MFGWFYHKWATRQWRPSVYRMNIQVCSWQGYEKTFTALQRLQWLWYIQTYCMQFDITSALKCHIMLWIYYGDIFSVSFTCSQYILFHHGKPVMLINRPRKLHWFWNMAPLGSWVVSLLSLNISTRFLMPHIYVLLSSNCRSLGLIDRFISSMWNIDKNTWFFKYI